ncbi:MAG: hypothetical protein H0T46_19685 [Deltaproteobacteria bacterium]|nr:hypothetical protein [Deltaproteobacteria bacterium]
MNHIYLGAVAFGVTLLVASIVMGGKDTDSGGGGDADVGLGWAPVGSLRFWVFLLAFGGGAGLALEALGSSTIVSAIGAGVVGWLAGAIAVAVVRSLNKNSVSSHVKAAELVGTSGTLMLPVGPGKPGKVRVEIKGSAEDYVANLVEDEETAELPTGTPVLVVAEGERGSLLVAKAEM